MSPWLYSGAIFLGALVLARYSGRAVFLALRGLLVAALAIVFIEAITGGSAFTSPSVPRPATAHRWGGQAALIVCWTAMLVAVAAHIGARTHPWWKVLFSLLAAAAVTAICLSANVTGYLNISRASVETQIRFTVLHGFILPFLLGLILIGWLMLLWPRRSTPIDAIAPTDDIPLPVPGPPDPNPYASPRAPG